MRQDGKLDYLEMPGGDLPALKAFYAGAHGGSGQGGGEGPAPLPVLFSTDLAATLAKVEVAGAEITRPIFPFPGGRRFHFRDPAGNELAVWGDPTEAA